MSRAVVMTGWDETPHLSEKAKADLLSAYPVEQRNARTKGIPQLGSGAIYPIDESEIIVDPFEIPYWYRHVYAMDVGWNRTAALWAAVDPETDTAYLYSEHYRAQAEPAIHAQSVLSRGRWIPGVIDPASRGRSQADGEQLFTIYSTLGLVLTPADNGVESGIYQMWSRLSTGKMKVFKHLQNFLMEFRIYRRDEKGKVVKDMDHLMDCGRYLCTTGITLAAQKPPDQWNGLPGKSGSRFTSDYNPASELYGAGSRQNTQAKGWMPGRS